MKELNIYCIDDDKEINRLLERIIFAEFSVMPKTFVSVSPFLNEVKNFTPDACIIDINLQESEGAGFQVIQAIRKMLDKKIKIFVLSRRNQSIDIIKAFDLGVDEYFTKPIDNLYLIEKLKQHLFPTDQKRSTLPFKNIGSADSDLFFSFNLELVSLSESTFTIRSKNIIQKGTVFNLVDEKLESLIGQSSVEVCVHNSWHEGDYYFFELDIIRDEEQISRKLRNWIMEQNSKED